MECCEKFLEQICTDLSENIDSKLCQQLREHLEECEVCRREVESLRDTVHVFQCLKEKAVPRDIHERLHKLLNVPDA